MNTTVQIISKKTGNCNTVIARCYTLEERISLCIKRGNILILKTANHAIVENKETITVMVVNQ